MQFQSAVRNPRPQLKPCRGSCGPVAFSRGQCGVHAILAAPIAVMAPGIVAPVIVAMFSRGPNPAMPVMRVETCYAMGGGARWSAGPVGGASSSGCRRTRTITRKPSDGAANELTNSGRRYHAAVAILPPWAKLALEAVSEGGCNQQLRSKVYSFQVGKRRCTVGVRQSSSRAAVVPALVAPSSDAEKLPLGSAFWPGRNADCAVFAPWKL